MSKQPRIFALQGVANAGKTTTLKLLYDLILQKYPQSIIVHCNQVVEINAILTIGDLTIGIESQGDPGSRLKNSLEEFTQKHCDLIFCAARTRGMTVGWINAYKGSHQITFVPKPQEPDPSKHDQVNQAIAKKLISLAGL